MRNSRNTFTLLMALVLAAAAAAAVYFYSNSAEEGETTQIAPVAAQTATSAPTVAVLIAKYDIAANTSITADMVEIKQILPADMNTRALTAPEEAVGKITMVELAEGEQIISSRLTNLLTGDDQAETFAYEVPVGKRAFSVVFNEVIGAGALVQPGDHVDVIAYFAIDVKLVDIDPETVLGPGDNANDNDGDNETDGDNGDDSGIGTDEFTQYSSTYIVQDVEVLWVAQAIEPRDEGVINPGQPAPPTPTPTPESTAEATTTATATATAEEPGNPVARPTAISVTLALTPEQAQRLQLAALYVEEQGMTGAAGLRLSLRSPGDTTTVDLPPAQLGEIPIGGLLGTVNQQMVPSDVVVTDVEFTRTMLAVGEVLEFTATVKNVSDRTIVSGENAPPKFTYTQDVAYDALGFYSEPGTYRLGLNVSGASPTQYPYRWSLGRDLKPGESIEVVGSVKMTKPAPATQYWLGVILEPGTVAHDGAGVEAITVLQPSAVVVRDAVTHVRTEPGADAPVAAEVKQGDHLTVLETRGDWYRVATEDGKRGWVSAAAVDVVPLAPSEPGIGTPVSGANATPVSATPAATPAATPESATPAST